MREMKDSGVKWIGEIPGDWKVFRNKNAFICKKEIIGKKSYETQLLSLTTKGIKKKDINNAEGKLPETFDTYQIVYNDNIVMCLFDLDVSAVFSGISIYDGMISPAYKILTCKKCVTPQYADYWFQYIGHGRKFTHYAKNIRFTLNIDEFMGLPMLFPTIEEQRLIVDYLNKKCSMIKMIIEKQEQIIEKLKAYKSSFITEMVSKGIEENRGLKKTEISWMGDIPETWRISHIGNLCEIGSGGTPDRNNPAFWDNGTIPWMASGEINFEYVYDTAEKITELGVNNSNAKILPVNTVMLGLIGQGRTKGLTAILKIESTCNQNLAYLKPEKTMLHYEYLFYCFKAMYKYIRSLVGESQAGIYQNMIKKLYIPLPPLEEQRLISEKLNRVCKAVDNEIEKRSLMINKLEKYKESLIYECVTGKKEVLAQPDAFLKTGINPAVLEQIRNHAKKCGIHKVILFGSRARGTFHRDSDIDLAVSGGNIDLFRLAVEEETDTLLAYDVVNLDRTSNEELLDVIRKEGVIIYEEV